jgi:hypothetical protein
MLKQYGIPVNEFAEYIDIAFAGEKCLRYMKII